MMPRIILIAALVMLAGSGALAGEADLTGRQIVDRYLERQTVGSELAFIVMTVSRPGAEKKEYRFLTAYRREADGAKKGLIRLVRPKDVEGVTLLALQDAKGTAETYVHMPALGETTRLAGAALDQPFLGSDYSYKDLLAEVPSAHHYERLKDFRLREIDCYQVRAVEKEGPKDRLYAYRELLIDKEKLQLVRILFYAADGKLVKTFMPYEYGSSEVKGETTRPRRAVMVRPGDAAQTEFRVVESRLNRDIPPEIFTTTRIESWKPEEVEEFIFQFGITVLATASE